MPTVEIDHVTLDRLPNHRAYLLADLADTEARGDLARSRTLRRILDQEPEPVPCAAVTTFEERDAVLVAVQDNREVQR